MKRILIAALFLACGAALFGADKLKIVTSIAPLYNITRAIAGDRAEISMLVPPGASPHTFSPKPSQLKDLANADIFIQAGAGLEFWANKMIKASGNKKLVVIAMTGGQKLIGGDADEPGGNPHVWLDPARVKEFAGLLCESLGAADTVNREYYRKNYREFAKEIGALDKYLSAEIKKFRIKELVSFHPAWAYFEARYGLREIAVIEAVPGRMPSPKELQAIVAKIKKTGIKTIFAEPQLPRKAADVIAKEAGVSVLILDPLGKPGVPYADFIKGNFEIIKEVMQ